MFPNWSIVQTATFGYGIWKRYQIRQMTWANDALPFVLFTCHQMS